MNRLDLDAIHKARREAEGDDADRPVVILGGREYTLPMSPPAALMVGLGRMQKRNLGGAEDMFRALFGDELDRVLAEGLEIEDLQDIFAELYGMDLGESPASGG